VEQALATHGAPHPDALRVDLDLLGAVDLRNQLSQITQPTLLIAGQNDRVTPADATRWIAAQLPNARFAQIPRAGHASFISHTDEFLALLQPFLAEHGALP
jgi:pimeloyl-[acyl-carrier protein] methyl ester esterase